ncbi:glycerophosphodiester phosphodiesterase [Evansella sp. LMS18]|jgi:glycerophosphoryl diester phosphodiesterase|uniref:glycerophosphodiester phosphodiesterase family protein n=1 Tax=Evansella sp. LMS18 TaxID=2924033 RepID=UPI0020D0FFFC|nr:glycerophosphodiester phosphodiesterase family protein [Evansella sp. LMS18]UTR09373.1 glycerophosphodiester phosphodiesterase [Evansella sp. LMS18]
MKIIAHRGNKRYRPENTMAAFISAAEYSIDGIELDVQVTRDHIPVVIHDSKIDRTTNGRGNVNSFTFKELRNYDAGSWFSEEYRGEKIPSLEEVLLWARERNITMHVELKEQKGNHEKFLDSCLAVIHGTGTENKVVISTFAHSYLPYIKDRNSSMETALLTKTPIIRISGYRKAVNADSIHIRHSYYSAKFYRAWVRNGLTVRTYNVNRTRDALRCKAAGVEGIISDDPKKMSSLLG